VTFESGSRLSRIEPLVFSECSALTGIAIPAAVEVLCAGCFCECGRLAQLVFESDSKLSRIEEFAFLHCSVLSSVSFPPSVEVLAHDCFSHCENLRTVTFEPRSKLSQIDALAFQGCAGVSKVFIPPALASPAQINKAIVAAFPKASIEVTVMERSSNLPKLRPGQPLKQSSGATTSAPSLAITSLPRLLQQPRGPLARPRDRVPVSATPARKPGKR
jgi:hypothetical protein